MDRLFILTFLILLSSEPVLGQLVFAEPTLIMPTLVEVERAFVGDLDQDGTKEIILGSTGPGHVIALKIGADTVTTQFELLDESVVYSPMHAADIDNDGVLDLVRGRSVASPPIHSFRIELYLGTGNGSVSSPIGIEHNGHVIEVTTADLTGDGFKEIIVRRPDRVDVYNYQPVPSTLQLLRSFPGTWEHMTTGDLTADGTSELLLNDASSIHCWNAAQGIQAPTFLVGTYVENLNDLTTEDLDGDGRNDVVASMSPYAGARFFRYWSGQGTNVFLQGPDLPLGVQVHGTFLWKDLNGDGRPEAFINTAYGILHWEISSNLTISDADTLFPVQPKLDRLVFDDLNGDGLPDLIGTTQDNRLIWAKGSVTPDHLEPFVELYRWPHRDRYSISVSHPVPSQRPKVAFIGRNRNMSTDLFVLDIKPFEVPFKAQVVQLPNSNDFGAGSSRLILGDVDADGDEDMVCFVYHWGSFEPCHLSWMENVNGSYVKHCIGSQISMYGSMLGSPFLFDVDGDGLVDILMQANWTDPSSPNFHQYRDHYFRQVAPRQFELQTIATPLPMGTYRRSADLNGDGLMDLFVQNTSNKVSIYRNEGMGVFTALPPVLADAPLGFVWMDADGDSLPELIGWRQVDGQTSTYFHKLSLDGPEPRVIISEDLVGNPMDFDRNGWVDIVEDLPIDSVYGGVTLQARLSQGPNGYSEPVHLFTGIRGRSYPLDADLDGDRDVLVDSWRGLFFVENITPKRPHDKIFPTMSVFPNPSSGAFRLALPEVPSRVLQVTVYDASGRSVHTSAFNAQYVDLNLQATDAGIYLINVLDPITGEGYGTARLLLTN